MALSMEEMLVLAPKTCADPGARPEDLLALLSSWPQPEDAPEGLNDRILGWPSPFDLLALAGHPNLPVEQLAEAASLAVRWHDAEGRSGAHLVTKDLPAERLAILALDGSPGLRSRISMSLFGSGDIERGKDRAVAILQEAGCRGITSLDQEEDAIIPLFDAARLAIDLWLKHSPKAASLSAMERLDLLSLAGGIAPL